MNCVQMLLSFHINLSLLGGMDAQCKVFSFVSFKILITPYLLRLTLLLSHVFCHATCRCEQYRKLVFYILHSLQYILITDALKTEIYLNYIHKTSCSTTHTSQSTSITKTKMQVTFKEKRVIYIDRNTQQIILPCVKYILLLMLRQVARVVVILSSKVD